MKRDRLSSLSISLVVLLATTLIACGGSDIDFSDYPPATFTNSENAQMWASASAPNIVGLPLTLFVSAELTAGQGCPAMVENGNATTLTGGCTDMNGNQWHGEARGLNEVTSGFVEFEGFGTTGESEDCPGTLTSLADGDLTLAGNLLESDFSVELEIVTTGPLGENCEDGESRIAISYDGTLVRDGVDGEEIWNGRGQFAETSIGVATVATNDEIIDADICDGEALSGTTDVQSDGHTLTISYDGATDCSPESTVRWAIDGVDQGEWTGVTCSAGLDSTSDLGLLLCALVLVSLGLRRRQCTTTA